MGEVVKLSDVREGRWIMAPKVVGPGKAATSWGERYEVLSLVGAAAQCTRVRDGVTVAVPLTQLKAGW